MNAKTPRLVPGGSGKDTTFKVSSSYQKPTENSTLPKLNPLVRIGLDRFRAELEQADYSREVSLLLDAIHVILDHGKEATNP